MIRRLLLAHLFVPLAMLPLVSSCGGDPGPRTREQQVSLAPPPRAIIRAAVPRTPPPQVIS